MFQDYSTYTNAEIERWIHLRAIEWSGWPTFISLPVVPVLLVFYPWPVILIGLLCVDFVWQLIQHAFVCLPLSEISCFAVVLLKWPTALVSSGYLFFHGSVAVGILALLWPLIGSLVTGPIDIALSWLGLRRSLGSISIALARRIGYVPSDDQSESSVPSRSPQIMSPLEESESFDGPERKVMQRLAGMEKQVEAETMPPEDSRRYSERITAPRALGDKRKFWETRIGVGLRWALVLPTAIAGAIFAQIVNIVATLVFAEWVAQLSSTIMMTGGFMFFGCLVAPKFKKATAWILAVLYLAFIALVTVSAWLEEPFVWMAINSALAACMAVGIAASIKEPLND